MTRRRFFSKDGPAVGPNPRPMEQKEAAALEKEIQLYLHVPFCLRRCPYCNFYSTTDLSLREAFCDAVRRALEAAPLAGRRIVTVYFGGGTPSLLGEGLISLLDAVRRWTLAPDAEITLEANPGTVDLTLLRRWREAGFNRISFGLQAAEETALRALGRIHTAGEGLRAVALAREAGFENISGDIMLATPGQTAAQAAALTREVAGLGIQHLSAYLLKVEPDTPFGRAGVERRCPGPDEAADLYLAACEAAEAAGLRQYEISNFARPGFESRHNRGYWELRDYLGIGPSAHSLLDGRRFFFPGDLEAFLQAAEPWSLPVQDGAGGTAEEYLMLSLRLTSGLDLGRYAQRYGGDAGGLLRRAQPLETAGLIEAAPGRLRLTRQGFLVSNAVIERLLE